MFSPGARAAADNPKLTPLVADIIAPPYVVPGSDGKRHIVYELMLTPHVPPLRLENVLPLDLSIVDWPQ